MSDQQNLDLGNPEKKTGPVECLGRTFESEDARRAHYTELLREKLKDPEFRKIEGFPIGDDEDILNLSDPPYYTACPNPWMQDFIEHYGKPYDPKVKYHREPFAADVSEGKNHPIYNAHSYHTKVPHRAIMRYILHYTEPGDIVFDGFCGTGMTGVAAQLCGVEKEVRALGYRVDADGTIYNEEGKVFSKLGARRAVLNDLSPAATFIAYNYNTPVDVAGFEREARRILREVEDELGWMYETTHTDGSKGRINYTVWSDVFRCPECGKEVNFWESAVDNEAGKVRDTFHCPHCNATLTKRNMDRAQVTFFDTALGERIVQAKQVPVLINYTAAGKRYQKKPDAEDLKLIQKIDETPIPDWFPTDRLPEGQETRRNDPQGITHVHHFYTRRNLAVLAALWRKCERSSSKIVATGILNRSTKMNRIHLKNFFFGGGGWNAGYLKGTLYISSIPIETSMFEQWKDRTTSLLGAFNAISFRSPNLTLTNSTTTSRVAKDSADYIFVDPPFGANLNYSELNILWESWLKVLTNNKSEAIENKVQGKGPAEYRQLMTACFKEAYRVLKPGRWMTVEFSNTSAAVWNSIQAALSEAGFVVANVSALDKKQGSFKAVTTTTAVKQDLVISAYKPNGGLERRFAKHGESVEGVWDFLQTHLKHLPITKPKGGALEFISDRDPRILYDRMVAFYVAHDTPVPLSSGEFQAALHKKYPERNGMVFLPEQVAEYDKKAAHMQNLGQMSVFVEDEKSAINWLRQFLKDRPSIQSDITHEFMQQLSASWKKFETRPELSVLLDQNFIKYDGKTEVPSQIHSYLSTNFKDLRNLDKNDTILRAKAANRWYVPDPKKAADVDALREKRLLQEFWNYLPEELRPAKSVDQAPTLPGFETAKPKTKLKKLKEVRTEAIRAGFKHCFQKKDYRTILTIAEILPNNVIEEDEHLQMIYDMAEMRG